MFQLASPQRGYFAGFGIPDGPYITGAMTRGGVFSRKGGGVRARPGSRFGRDGAGVQTSRGAGCASARPKRRPKAQSKRETRKHKAKGATKHGHTLVQSSRNGQKEAKQQSKRTKRSQAVAKSAKKRRLANQSKPPIGQSSRRRSFERLKKEKHIMKWNLVPLWQEGMNQIFTCLQTSYA